jgi:dTDP-4-dehydrorhamnose reductase
VPGTALVIGASGQVGGRLLRFLQAQRVPAVGTVFQKKDADPALHPLDVRDAAAVQKLVAAVKPAWVFLASALTHVDYCEEHPDEARAINVTGVANVAAACGAAGAKLVFLSTEYVFDGAAGPYREDDPIHPLGVYAQTKADGEKAALALPDALVARTTVVYDWDPAGKNFVMQLIQRLSAGETMRVPNDQWSHPTLARNLVAVLWELTQKDARGIFHVVGPDYMHRYDFARRAAEALDLKSELLQPVSTAALNQKARRPLKAGLLTEKVRAMAATPLTGVWESLLLVKKDWDAARTASSAE